MSFETLKQTHPALHERWFTFLQGYAKKNELPDEWVTYGLWRLKNPSPIWRNILRDKGMKWPTIKRNSVEELSLSITKGFSPCVEGGYSLKGKFSAPLDLETITDFLTPISKDIDYQEDLGIITVKGKFKSKTFRFNLFSDGAIFLQTFDEIL